jgi:hypothetical protein
MLSKNDGISFIICVTFLKYKPSNMNSIRFATTHEDIVFVNEISVLLCTLRIDGCKKLTQYEYGIVNFKEKEKHIIDPGLDYSKLIEDRPFHPLSMK